MKKLLLLVMIFPLFFACKHNTTSNTPQEPEQIPQCGDGMCNGEETCETCPTDCPSSITGCEDVVCNNGTICVNGECVPEEPLNSKKCIDDKVMVMTEEGWVTADDCPYGCANGACREPVPECTKDDDCSGGMHCDTTSGHCVSD